MKILLVYPEYPPNTYWSFSHVMRYIGRRASMPPLGLITVAALLPEGYETRLVDMNVERLRDEDIRWADAVFTSTMIIQGPSFATVIRRCRAQGVPVVAGGPHPSAAPESVEGADHVIVGEAEEVLPRFLADFEKGCARPLYRAEGLPELAMAPIPRFDLLDLTAYHTMPVQYSRGCPFRCEFCDIWKIYGRRPRTKNRRQFLAELETLARLGWRGSVFVVDDNFIGDIPRVRAFLGELTAWQKARGYPFSLLTEASLNLARDETLLAGMREAGFGMVFLGIETPSVEGLLETHKPQNTRMGLLESVRAIQAQGIEVSGGFIVGFDSDPEDIFDRQIEFIQDAAIPMAMVGILTALPGTELQARLEREGRLLCETSGNNTHVGEANFVTRMPAGQLAAGYRKLVGALYDPALRSYFGRCRRMLRVRTPPVPCGQRTGWREVRAFLLSILTIPLRPYGRQFLRFLLWTLLRRSRRFPDAVRLGILGFHLQAITAEMLSPRTAERDVRLEAGAFEGALAPTPD